MNAATAESQLSFDLRRFLPARLTILSNRLARRAALLYAARFKLSAPEWRVIAVLAQQRVMSPNAVIAQTAMNKVRVSHVVAKLLKVGLITRDADAQDRRRAIIGLTAAGREMFQQIVPLIQNAEAEMLAMLSAEERDALTDALTRIETLLERK